MQYIHLGDNTFGGRQYRISLVESLDLPRCTPSYFLYNLEDIVDGEENNLVDGKLEAYIQLYNDLGTDETYVTLDRSVEVNFMGVPRERYKGRVIYSYDETVERVYRKVEEKFLTLDIFSLSNPNYTFDRVGIVRGVAFLKYSDACRVFGSTRVTESVRGYANYVLVTYTPKMLAYKRKLMYAITLIDSSNHKFTIGLEFGKEAVEQFFCRRYNTEFIFGSPLELNNPFEDILREEHYDR